MASTTDKLVVIPPSGALAQTVEALSSIGTRMLLGAGTVYTVATLPSAASSQGVSAVITDGLSLTPITGLGLPVVGGGVIVTKVWSNGTAWLIG